MRVKIFYENSDTGLEEKINNYIETKGLDDDVDVKVSAVYEPLAQSVNFIAVLIYE